MHSDLETPIELQQPIQAYDQFDSYFNSRHITWRDRTEYRRISLDGPVSDEEDLSRQLSTEGLGLKHVPSIEQTPPRIKRVPVGSKQNIRSPNIVSPTTSPLPGGFSQESTPQSGLNDFIWNDNSRQSRASTGDVHGDVSHSSGLEYSPYNKNNDSSFKSVQHCPTHRDIIQSRWSWYPITVLVLAIYSTVFSAIFLIIAAMRPRWRDKIGTGGKLSFSTATLLSALFSKTVELSFATVFVALLGQKLSRKAFAYNSSHGGISLAEMNMRSWIMQPGTLLTHWKALKYTLFSKLGAAALVAAIVAALYTTAAEVLVAPKLKLGGWESRVLGGRVATAYANASYLGQQCQSPISLQKESLEDHSTTCLQISYSGRGLHDFQSFISNWTQYAQTNNVRADTASFSGRPLPTGMLYDNTTVIGQWLQSGNITQDSAQAERMLLNVSMVMPHANLFHAARESINHILQPEDFQGQGEYLIRASVVSPMLNVVCAGLDMNELYIFFNQENRRRTDSMWPDVSPELDRIFSFIANNEQSPLFTQLPLPYNTVVNITADDKTGAVYLLGASPEAIDTNPYVLCSLRSQLYSFCTNKYHVTQSGGELSVHCDDDPENVMPYFDSFNSERTAPQGIWDRNWRDIGAQWITSVALNDGVLQGNAASARLVTQMMPSYSQETGQFVLNPSKPSIAEALAVIGGVTLLMGSSESQFIHYWNYTDAENASKERPLEYFPAQVRYRDYASGPSQNWQYIFYLVLAMVFIMDLYAMVNLMYHFIRNGQVTDYTEPQNMFALALMSKPSSTLSGSCGGRPDESALGAKWSIGVESLGGTEGTNPHFYVHYKDSDKKDVAFGQMENQKSVLRRLRLMSMSTIRPGKSSWNSPKQDWESYRGDQVLKRSTFKPSRRNRRATDPSYSRVIDTDYFRVAASNQTPVMRNYMRLSGISERL